MSDQEKGYIEGFAAERAARLAYEQSLPKGRRKVVLGQDVAPWAGFRNATFDPTAIFSDPTCFLKEGESKNKDDFLWRKPDDSYTKSMVSRGIIRPVFTDEVDKNSRYASVDSARQITKNGPRHVVRSPAASGCSSFATEPRCNRATWSSCRCANTGRAPTSRT